MVGGIDIHRLNLDELTGVVNIYPWYAAARMELCARLKDMDMLSDTQVAQAGLYIGSRRKLFNLVRNRERLIDENAPRIVREAEPAPQQEPAPQAPARQIFVVGGDYFSQNDYNGVRRTDDNIFSSFATKARSEGYVDQAEADMGEFCTETLAQVYLEQGYPAEAKKIYSKLILRYPEKSVYFASLIEKIEKNY